MRLATCSLDATPAAIRLLDPGAVVSAFSPSRPIAPLTGRRHLRLAFHDVETPVPGPRAGASERQVDAFLELVAASHDNLLVHCVAGLGRSPALAMVALAATGRSPAEAAALVRAAVPEASPNRLVLSRAGRALGMDLVAAAEGAFRYRRGPAGATGACTGLRRVLP